MLSPLKSIRKYCLDCSNDSPKEVKLCPNKDCPLYVYRFGKRVRDPTPSNKPKRTISPEHLKKLQEGRLKNKERLE
jgi:hypothetical protein